MQIPSGVGNARVAKRRLHKVYRCTPIKSVRGMDVAQPMRRHIRGQVHQKWQFAANLGRRYP